MKMLIKNVEILKYLDLIQVDLESNFITKYINFLLLDQALNVCESIVDIDEKEDATFYIKNALKEQVSVVQKDKNDIKNIFLQKESLTYLNDHTFELFKYKFNQLKKSKENYLNSYLLLY